MSRLGPGSGPIASSSQLCLRACVGRDGSERPSLRTITRGCVTLLLRMRRHIHAFGITVYACAGMSTRSVLLYTYIICI